MELNVLLAIVNVSPVIEMGVLYVQISKCQDQIAIA